MTVHRPEGWLEGPGMDPAAVPAEPLPSIAGFPFLVGGGCSALISGPTGGGRSYLIQACTYDAAKHSVKVLFLGGEITQPEFNDRARDLIERRGDSLDDSELLRRINENVVYRELDEDLPYANANPAEWVASVVVQFDVVVLDPLSSVASTLGLDFDQKGVEFDKFYDRLIHPLVKQGIAVVTLDNIGHNPDAKERAKGVSSKGGKMSLTFSCEVIKNGTTGLKVKATKVRNARAPFRKGDEWLFDEPTRRVASVSEPDEVAAFEPTRCMEAVSRVVEGHPGIKYGALQESVTGFRNDVIRRATNLLVERGFIKAEPKRGVEHYSVKPFRETADGFRAATAEENEIANRYLSEAAA